MHNNSLSVLCSVFPGVTFIHEIFNSFDVLGDDIDLFCNGSSSCRLITRDHDYLDTSTTAFQHCIRYGVFGRINKGNQTNECEIINWEIEFFWIRSRKLKAQREFRARKMETSESKDTFTLLAEMKVDFGEFVRPFFRFRFVFAFNDNLSAIVPYFLRRTFHVNAIVAVCCFLLYDSEGEFV